MRLHILNMGLIEISCSRLRQYKNSMLIPLLHVLGCFINFWLIFGYIWEEILFSQRIGKIRSKKKRWRFNVVLKYEFEVNNM